MRSMRPRGVGQSGHIRDSFTSTSSPKVPTSRRGNSRNSSCQKCARRSNRCGSSTPIRGWRAHVRGHATKRRKQADVHENINIDRRRFLRRAAMTIVGAHIGRSGTAAAAGQEPRELAALGRAVEWLNSPRLTPSSLAGKVVLVDFWTYTCINWLRTLPYLRAWSQKYAQGLVVIGVHTPEVPFERNVDNVRHAVQQMRIEYPIVIDNGYSIWRAFKNQYWPALYFLDARGRIRQHQFGEGEYEQSERAIQRLLSEA